MENLFFSFIWKSFYLYIYIEIHISSSIFLIQLCCANSAVNTSGTALRRAEIEKNKTKSKLSDYGCCFRRDSLNSPCLPVCPPAEVSRSNALNLYHGRLCTAIGTQILGCSWPIVRTKHIAVIFPEFLVTTAVNQSRLIGRSTPLVLPP